jgi:hypothetical protein
VAAIDGSSALGKPGVSGQARLQSEFGNMIDSVSKPKLPKGLSFVLKTSQLEQALSDIDCHVDLVYWIPQGGGSILEGHYWLPNDNVPYSRVYVRAGAIPSALRFAASEALRESALPKFIGWLRGILALSDRSPALPTEPYFDAQYTAEGLTITHQRNTRCQGAGGKSAE